MAPTSTKKGNNIMSRKHFIDFANEIAAMTNREEAKAYAEMVANVARRHNGNFDYNRFMTACGIED